MPDKKDDAMPDKNDVTPIKAEIDSLDQAPVWLTINVPREFIVLGKYLNLPGRKLWALDAGGNRVETIKIEIVDSPSFNEMSATATAKTGTAQGCYRVAIGVDKDANSAEARYPPDCLSPTCCSEYVKEELDGKPTGKLFGLVVI